MVIQAYKTINLVSEMINNYYDYDFIVKLAIRRLGKDFPAKLEVGI